MPDWFGKRLKSAIEQLGFPFQEFAVQRANISDVTAWRLTAGKGSVKAAVNMLSAIRKAASEKGMTIDLPPLVIDAPPDLEEWIGIGHRLRSLSPEQFKKALESVRQVTAKLQDIEGLLDSTDDFLHPTKR